MRRILAAGNGSLLTCDPFSGSLVQELCDNSDHDIHHPKPLWTPSVIK